MMDHYAGDRTVEAAVNMSCGFLGNLSLVMYTQELLSRGISV